MAELFLLKLNLLNKRKLMVNNIYQEVLLLI